MPNRSELQQISEARLEEAKALFAGGHYDGACYLAGYAVETALKARICKLLDEDFPPGGGDIARAYRIHRLDDLLLLAGLRKQLQQKAAADLDFETNWSLVKSWNEAKRYDTIGSNSQTATQELLNALEDTTCGILTWIKTLW